jgi:hypothetical protein
MPRIHYEAQLTAVAQFYGRKAIGAPDDRHAEGLLNRARALRVAARLPQDLPRLLMVGQRTSRAGFRGFLAWLAP